jgi:hypothetical protein
MQDSSSELNAERLTLPCALLCVLAATALAAGPRLWAGPSTEDWTLGRTEFLRLRTAAAVCACLAGVLAALSLWVLPRMRAAARGVGICCGASLAALAHVLLAANASGPVELAVEILPAAVLGFAAGPLLRDRGLLALLLAGVAVGAPLVLARRSMLADLERARVVQRLRDEVQSLAVTRAFVAADARVDREQRVALVHALRPPFVESPVALFSPDASIGEQALLEDSGFAGVCCIEGQITHVEARPGLASAAPTLRIDAELRADGTPLVQVRATRTPCALRVLTALRSYREPAREPSGGLALAEAVGKSFLSDVASLPSGTPILVRAESELGAVSEWLTVTTAAHKQGAR